jgi:hypothetical protein
MYVNTTMKLGKRKKRNLEFEWAGGVAQVVEHLLSKHKALTLNIGVLFSKKEQNYVKKVDRTRDHHVK